jgi:hypothetical protein
MVLTTPLVAVSIMETVLPPEFGMYANGAAFRTAGNPVPNSTNSHKQILNFAFFLISFPLIESNILVSPNATG